MARLLLPFLLASISPPLFGQPDPDPVPTLPSPIPFKPIGVPPYLIDHEDYDAANCGLGHLWEFPKFRAPEYGEAAQMMETLAAVLLMTTDPYTTCTGTLISKRHVLTAAHCLHDGEYINAGGGRKKCRPTDYINHDKYLRNALVFWGGPCFRSGTEGCTKDQTMKRASIEKVTVLPFYEGECTNGMDLVIIQLSERLNVSHACLPHLKNESLLARPHQEYFSFGWGSDPRSAESRVFHNRNTWVYLGSEIGPCRKYMDWAPWDTLCFPAQHMVDMCSGDSGSGMMTRVNGRITIVGVLSSGYSCDEMLKGQSAPTSSFFTDVRLYAATINRELNMTPPFPDLGAA